MKQVFHFFIAIGIILFTSCAKLPVYKSREYQQDAEINMYNASTSYSDEKENINIAVSNNDTNLYVQVVFHNRESLMKIMRGGLIVCFDPTGKKDKTYRLKIDKSETMQTTYGQQPLEMSRPTGDRQQNLPEIIKLAYNKVTWDKNGKEFVFYRNLLKDPIQVDLEPNEKNELQLNLKIPFKELPQFTNQNLFSLGIETGENSAKQGMSGNNAGGGGMRQSGGMRGGGGGGRSGGGMGGGGGRSGGGMGGGGGSRPAGNSSSGANMNPIKVWIQVQL